jgi:two-component system, LytTR family, sensor kinase
MVELPNISQYKIVIVNLLWWSFWVILQWFVLLDLNFGIAFSLADALVFKALLAISSYVLSLMVKFCLPSLKNLYYLLAASIGLAFLMVYLENDFFLYLWVNQLDYEQFFQKTFSVRFAFALLMLVFRMLTSWVYYYLKAQQEQEIRRADTEKMWREAALFKLQQQLQPHFLFNSLNSISALLGNRPEEARRMLQNLSDFLRGTLKKDERQLFSLEEELQHLNLYLEIEKVRFGNRLSTEIEIATEANKLQLPSFLLQPIVENAIKFGLYDTVDEIIIRINATVNKNILVIQIENPYDPSTSVSKSGTGFGLNSVNKRLNLLYARNDLLQVSALENTFITTIKIPQT